ncbi:MAG TPA: molybdopterin-dependent oxidoreductase, partial [Firmicutes bacterium]|nr:molybdopterin-dependent oxidoreductase [Bacillota bacterium]
MPAFEVGTAVGSRTPLLEAREKVCGRTIYISDLKLPGMLVGKVLRSPLAHGRIVSIDASRAWRVPGVKAVVTGSDCPPVRWGGMVPDQYILPVDGRVRFVGDEVAAVAATSEDAAREALALIDVEYEELPVLLDPQEALSSPVEIHARTEDGASPNLAFRHRVVLGDPEAGFRESEMVIERTYRTSYQNAGYLEPVACVAEPDGRGRLTVWCPTHDPFAKKATIARALGLEPHQVRVRQAAIGGSFGGKIHHKSYFLAGLLALRAGRPVKLLDSREEALSVT